MYSSIEEAQRKEAIERCYYPLLELAENGVPIGIELTGLTLEIINDIDKSWIDRFKTLLAGQKVELIGSGYSQIIGPLFPKKLNIKNQELGLETYRTILGATPEIALVNEMAYSAGLVDIYKETGYKAMMMEWNNPYRFHKEIDKNMRYFPQYAVGVDETLPVIWADSIAFQKFQRYAHGELTLDEYLEYLDSHDGSAERYFPLYANDAEVFNFRPGRFKTESKIEHDEWKRIERLFSFLKNLEGVNLILPSQTLEGLQKNELALESPQQPIVVKKQEKYNINRWALTGRDDLAINTKIFQIYMSFLRGSPANEDWKKLLYLASSDFRTHITENRWIGFKKELTEFSNRWHFEAKADSLQLLPKKPKINQTERLLKIETKDIKCVFNKLKGLSVKELYLKNKSGKPLIGTLPHGYYEDISLGADFFSFHSIIEKPGQHKYTNLFKTEPDIRFMDNFVLICDRQHDRDIIFRKSVRLFLDRARIEMEIDIQMPKRVVAIIHPLNITFMPESFDKASLFYRTNNGGNLETFYMRNMAINHSQSLSTLISAKYGLGATEGALAIGDKNNTISIMHDQTVSALIPSIHYLPSDGSFFLRLEYSAQEIDDTFKENDKPQAINCLLSIE